MRRRRRHCRWGVEEGIPFPPGGVWAGCCAPFIFIYKRNFWFKVGHYLFQKFLCDPAKRGRASPSAPSLNTPLTLTENCHAHARDHPRFVMFVYKRLVNCTLRERQKRHVLDEKDRYPQCEISYRFTIDISLLERR